MDTAALARQLAELGEEASSGPWLEGDAGGWNLVMYHGEDVGAVAKFSYEPNLKLAAALRNNFPAILRALCVMSAVEDGLGAAGTVIADKRCLLAVNERADELLAECTGAKS